MVRRSHILISLVSLLLLVAMVASNAPVYSQNEPATITGVLRYKERGPDASPTGIANALLVGGVGAPVAIVRLSNAIDMLTMVPPLNENPSMKSVSEFLHDGVPIDLAQAFPIVAGYDAEVRFTLEQTELTTFTLQRGTVSWSSDNSTELTGGRKPGSADKTRLPADVPVYTPVVVESYSIGDTHIAGFQRVSEQSEAVIAYFREAMPKHNWDLVAERRTETAFILSWAKDNRSCQTEIVPAETVTEIWLRCSTVPK